MIQSAFLRLRLSWIMLVAALFAGPSLAQDPSRELTVHLAQANNTNPYAFVRAKFEPGEVTDPWSVRFFDRQGEEVPYFVWDSVTWKVAREGRPDWGHRFALLNHHPGDAPEARQMRTRRLDAAKVDFLELGAMLSAQEEAAKRAGDSVCAALYLLRHPVSALGKEKLTLQVYPTRQIEPTQRTLAGRRVEQRLSSAAGELRLEGLPDKLAVHWKGRKLFKYAGFKLGDKSAGKGGFIQSDTHVDPAEPFVIEISEGIITKVTLRGQSEGRAGAATNWQCTYWLFPEGSYVALKGFSFDDSDQYLGGGLSMALWETPKIPEEVHEPQWELPWWLHQISESSFIATHQFTDTPLTIGYGNNPYCVSTPGSFVVSLGEKTKGQGDGLVELNWQYELTDKRIYRLFHPWLDNDGSYDLADVTDLRETLLTTGKLTKVPTDAKWKDGTPVWPPERVRALEEALKSVWWRPNIDWLYRQYLVGVGENAADAEKSIRQVLGAAAGWIDRPVEEEEIAELLVRFSLRKSSQPDPVPPHAWVVLPDALNKTDRETARNLLHQAADPVDMAADAMSRIRTHIAAGGDPIMGATKGGGEGWMGNPAYFAVDVPVSLRFMEHFQLFDLARRSQPEYRESLIEWADYSLEVLGGRPLDWDRLRKSYGTLWANRVVMLVPLMLRAYDETSDEKYARAARLLFDEVLMNQTEQNPQGYCWAWGNSPRKAELFDTNYNLASYDRGLIDFWSEGQFGLIGRERATQFVAAQARYLVFSGQFLDSLETDSMTAVQSQFPGGIPWAIGQLCLFLYDDFAFYRGLVADPIRWAVIDDGGTLQNREGRRNFYTLKIGARGAVFWAYGIGRNSPSRSKTAREMLKHWSR